MVTGVTTEPLLHSLINLMTKRWRKDAQGSGAKQIGMKLGSTMPIWIAVPTTIASDCIVSYGIWKRFSPSSSASEPSRS